MKQRTLRKWFLIHKWTSLICTLFVLLLCITGLPLIFHDEIEQALYAPPLETSTAQFAKPSIDQLVAAAKDQRPNEWVQFVFFAEDSPVLSVATAATLSTPLEQGHIQPFDRRSGEMLAPPPANSGFLYWMEEAHVRLFMGLPGTLFLGFMGLIFLLALVSGVVLYAPFMRKLPFASVRKQQSRRVKWLDLHNMLGIVTATWLFVVAATGVFNTLDVPIAGLWQATQLKEMLAAYENAPLLTELTSLDKAIATAEKNSPGMRPYSIAFPGNAFSSPQHYAIYMIGDSGLTKYLLRPVLVDAKTGELTAAREMPLLVKALFLSRPLHFGDYGGLPLKLIWALLDFAAILVLASGIYLWLGRNQKPLAPQN